MFFEDDEKDIIGNGPEPLDDDAVSWDSILETDEDGLVSIKNDSPSPTRVPTEVFSNNNDIPDLDSLTTDDEIDLITPVEDDSDDVDEEELKRILNSDDTAPSEYEYAGEEDFNIDEQLNNVDVTEAPIEDDILPRKEEVKKQQGTSPVLLALLFGVIVAAAIYFFFNFVQNKDDDIDLEKPSSNQEQDVDEEETSEEAQNQDNDIPVINEDEASELKPDEKQEEKKQVINIVPTGRTNPFMPLQKYIYVEPPKPAPPKPVTVVKTINNLDYDSITIPKPPKAYGEISEMTTKLMSIAVSGIMYDTQKPSAIINYDNDDYFVQIGDKLNNFRVVDIGPNYVKIAFGKNIYKANVGEEFKINEFYGNVPYQGGGRQYYSSEDEFTNRKENAKKYTSENDVQIYAR